MEDNGDKSHWIITEQLFCPRHCSSHWGYIREENRQTSLLLWSWFSKEADNKYYKQVWYVTVTSTKERK